MALNCRVRPTCTSVTAGATASAPPRTRNDAADVALPSGVETESGPVVAPVGTEATRRLGAAEVMTAGVPLDASEFWPGVALKPLPKICTTVPSRPTDGAKYEMRA